MNKTVSEIEPSAVAQDPMVRPASAADIRALCQLVREYWEHEKLPDFDEVRIDQLLQTALAPGGGAMACLGEW